MEQKIQRFNEWLSQQSHDAISIGLFDGQMGLCIYWYQQSRLYNDRVYEQRAGQLLDKVFSNVRRCLVVDLENGILGIGFGILYLLENKYIEGVVNNVLFELDEKIFQQLYFVYVLKVKKSQRELLTLTWGLLYLCCRLRTGILEQVDGFLYRALLVRGLNSLETALRDIPLGEPCRFSLVGYYTPVLVRLLSNMYKLDIFTDKLDMLCRGLVEKIYSSTPFNMGNRIVLCSEIEILVSNLKDQGIKSELMMYVNMLLQGIDVSSFLLNGLKDKQLSMDNGAAGILLYLGFINVHTKFQLDEDRMTRRLFDSGLWDDWKNGISCDGFPLMGCSMYHGLPGIIFSYQCYHLVWQQKNI